MSRKGKSSGEMSGGAALAPKLRFPEFVEHPLQVLRLADSTAESTKRNGSGQTSSQIMGVSKVEGIVPMEERIVAADTARYKSVRKDWFAYNPMRLNIGSIARWQGDDDILVSPDYVVFKCKSSGPHRLDPSYLDHFRRSHAWEDFASEKGDGSVRVRIYYKDLARLQLALPSYPEQQKIALCLDTADALIEVQGRKVEALRAHKKGLMQQLFPQKGETQPRLRLPEFEGAGEWRSKVLGNLIQLQSGFAFSSDYFENRGKKLVTPKNFTKFGFGNFEEVVSKHTTEVVPQKYICRPGDLLVLLTDLTPTCELLGKPLEVREIDGEVLLNQRIAKVELLSRDITLPFLKQLFLTDAYNETIVKTASGTTVKHSSNKLILTMSVVLPPLPEQQRIADCLTFLDDLIDAESQMLDTLMTHKKGLMQQLFPQVGEGDA